MLLLAQLLCCLVGCMLVLAALSPCILQQDLLVLQAPLPALHCRTSLVSLLPSCLCRLLGSLLPP